MWNQYSLPGYKPLSAIYLAPVRCFKSLNISSILLPLNVTVLVGVLFTRNSVYYMYQYILYAIVILVPYVYMICLSFTWKLMGGGGFLGSILTTLDSTFGGGLKLFLPTYGNQSQIQSCNSTLDFSPFFYCFDIFFNKFQK